MHALADESVIGENKAVVYKKMLKQMDESEETLRQLARLTGGDKKATVRSTMFDEWEDLKDRI